MDYTLGVTGHRLHKLRPGPKVARIFNDAALEAHLDGFAYAQLSELMAAGAGPTRVLTGMALGWDQAIALACVQLGIPFVAVVPFEGQDEKWTPVQRLRYAALVKDAADVYIACYGSYAPWKYTVRNQWVVDHCDTLWTLYDGESAGGTLDTIVYAWAQNRPMIDCWGDWITYLRAISES